MPVRECRAVGLQATETLQPWTDHLLRERATGRSALDLEEQQEVDAGQRQTVCPQPGGGIPHPPQATGEGVLGMKVTQDAVHLGAGAHADTQARGSAQNVSNR